MTVIAYSFLFPFDRMRTKRGSELGWEKCEVRLLTFVGLNNLSITRKNNSSAIQYAINHSSRLRHICFNGCLKRKILRTSISSHLVFNCIPFQYFFVDFPVSFDCLIEFHAASPQYVDAVKFDNFINQ